MKNTPHKGQVRVIVFQEKKTWYGVALEFNIVVSGSTELEAKFELNEAMLGYIETARKVRGARYEFLNQKPSKEYEYLWDILEAQKKVPSPYHVSYFGRQMIYAK